MLDIDATSIILFLLAMLNIQWFIIRPYFIKDKKIGLLIIVLLKKIIRALNVEIDDEILNEINEIENDLI